MILHTKRQKLVVQSKKILSSFLAIILVVGLSPSYAHADEGSFAPFTPAFDGFDGSDAGETSEAFEAPQEPQSDGIAIATGTWGTCPWEISAEGVLSIGSGDGANTFGVSPWEEYSQRITRVSFPTEPSSIHAPNDCSFLFASFTALEELDMSAWDMSQVTSMFGMFSNCTSLRSLDVSHWQTSRVVNMRHLFDFCPLLTELDLADWNTTRTTDMSGMFSLCTALKTIYVGSLWSTADVTSSSSMFLGCTSLEGGNGTDYDPTHTDAQYACIDTPQTLGYLTASIIASGMWGTCTWKVDVAGTLSIGDGNGADTEDMPPWREYASDIVSLVSPQAPLHIQAPSDCSSLFEDCYALRNIDLDSWDMSDVKDMSRMFYNCSAITSLDLWTWDTSQVTNMMNMFSACTSLETIYVSDFWSIESAVSSSGMFSGCSALVGENGTVYDPEHIDATYARVDSIDAPGYLSNAIIDSGMWGSCPWRISLSGVLSIGEGTGADTGGTSPWAFYSQSITSISYPQGASSIQAPEDCSFLFESFASLTYSDFSAFNTSNVKNMNGMFYGCTSLASLDTHTWHTSCVTNMSNLFYHCAALRVCNISNWDISNVVNVSSMFACCSALSTLDLVTWNTSQVRDMSYLFRACSSLKTIYIGDGRSTTPLSVSIGMFLGCYSLVGGNGTKYDPDHTDAYYARVDKPSAPGYFTSHKQVGFVPTPKVATGLVYTGATLIGLQADTGYTVTGGTAVNAGSYQATATLEEGYEWEDGDPSPSKTLTWQISPANLAKAKITLSATSFTYNGKVQKPSLKKVALGNKVLSASNYTYAIPASKKVGTYVVSVAGRGNYTGVVKVAYKILKKPTIKVKTTSKKVKAKDVKKKAQSFKLGASVNSKGKITYKVVKKNKKITFKKGKVTLKKGTTAGTYKTTIRINVAAKGAFGASFRNVTIKFVVKN